LQIGIVANNGWKKKRLQKQSRKKRNQQEIVGTIFEEKTWKTK
tara:strand:- start:375 stop:503 length:129 start_codon:yes stop_codon:yes gene_type:complete